MDLSNIRREDWGWFASAEHYAGQSQWEHDPWASCNRPVLGDLNIEIVLSCKSLSILARATFTWSIFISARWCVQHKCPFWAGELIAQLSYPHLHCFWWLLWWGWGWLFVLLTGWGELIAGVSCTDLELPALAPQLLDAVASLPLFRSIFARWVITFVAVISP